MAMALIPATIQPPRRLTVCSQFDVRAGVRETPSLSILIDYRKSASVAANGVNPNLSLPANGIIMQDPYGETSNPSDTTNGDIFRTCWGYGSLTPCTAGSFTTPPPATTASLSASPTKISSGQSSTPSWSSTNATSCTGGAFTVSGTSGSGVVYPSVTTSYSVTCYGPDGCATALATVTVGTTNTCHAKKCK